MQISLTKIEKVFHNEEKFTLCLANRLPVAFQSNKNIEAILQAIEQ